jgi:hypothetical protein
MHNYSQIMPSTKDQGKYKKARKKLIVYLKRRDASNCQITH